jgi:hypothetical protein
LAETREVPPTEATRAERAQRAQRSRKPVVRIIVVAIVILVAVGVFLAIRGKGPLAGRLPGTSKSPTLPTPDFSFRGNKAVAIPTVATQTAKKLRGAAKATVVDTTGVIHQLETAAFLDPANWQSGSYDSLEDVFADSARAQVQAHLDALTAGPQAGQVFSDIQPGKATISSEVLMDTHGAPFTVVATVTFTARGTAKDGPGTLFVSDGSFFLRQEGGSWKVVAFDVTRHDQVLKVASPSGSSSGGTPTGSPS